MLIGSSRKKSTLSVFISSTETTGVIGARVPAINSEDGLRVRNDGYIPKGSERGRHQSSVRGGSVGGFISGSSGGGWCQIGVGDGISKTGKGE